MTMNDSTTLAEARKHVAANSRDGVICPCCTQLVKVYRRKLNSGMARCLIHMYRYHAQHGDEWCHVHHYLVERGQYDGDFPKLRHWGLIEVLEGERADGSSRVGFYRITAQGRAFVREEVDAPRAVFLFNDKVLAVDEEERTTIRTALGDKFNYDELMNT